MNSKELSDSLAHCPVTKQNTTGVFASDNVPSVFSHLPAGCIVNTQPSNLPGEHWIALYQSTETEIEFFDSFGQQPSKYGLALDIMNGKRIVKQDSKIQSDMTTVCGQYCLFFLACRCGGKSFSDIVSVFSADRMHNDIVVRTYVNQCFGLKSKLIDYDFALC